MTDVQAPNTQSPSAPPDGKASATKHLARWAMICTIVGTVIALATLLLQQQNGNQDQSNNQNGTGNVIAEPGAKVTQDGTCVNVAGHCVVSNDASDSDKRKALGAAPGATVDPTGNGPWPFIVVDTLDGDRDIGLLVRDGYRLEDSTLPGRPTFPHAKLVWADCQVTDGFVADPSTSGGGTWYRVRFPEVKTSGDFWSYSGFLVPVAHNGNLPVCPADR